LMETFNEPGFINIGTGIDIQINDLAALVKDIVGFSGEIRNDTSKPDGTPRKLMDVSRLKQLGWSPRIELAEGIRKVYREFQSSFLQ
ncbi:MAG TPA: GDP-L-fucose synthase, partial [Flavitalea sp.]|nr:GDP-L-fucose synthase [Flavitalea sp.]